MALTILMIHGVQILEVVRVNVKARLLISFRLRLSVLF